MLGSSKSMDSSSKSLLFLPLIVWLLLFAIPTRSQDDDDEWFYIMADSKNSTLPCPGRCLAVNDTGTTLDYNNRPVVFVACKPSDSSTESSDSSSNTNNIQQWIRKPTSNPTTFEIRYNATGTQTNTIQIFCLQPDPANSNLTLKIASCTGHRNQQWIVANNTIATLAHNPPHFLAMSYSLAGFLNVSDGPLGWRHAIVSPISPPANNSLTTTFSMVDGTLDTKPPNPPLSREPNQTHNFITNPRFQKTSYDFPNKTANLNVNPSDPFSLCGWEVMKGTASLSPNPNLNPRHNETPTNQTLLLKDAVVRQNVATYPGAVYALMLKIAIAPPDQDQSDAQSSSVCSGNDTLSVNPYPSTNVHQDIEVSNGSWTTWHVSFQAVGSILQIAFQGCASCGCYLNDLYLLQVIDSASFPPPPFRPPPPTLPVPAPPVLDVDQFPFPGNHDRHVEGSGTHRLSNGTVVGMVVGTAALFLVIGAACFWVVVGYGKEVGKESEVGMGRPREWSIQTTTPPQSQGGARGYSSGATHHSISGAYGGASGGGGGGGRSGNAIGPTTTSS